MKKLIAFLFLLNIMLGVQAKLKETNYTILVSLDGFRWDYTTMYHTPFLNQIAAHGVKATMLPSFPASTFPNHYTLVTGLVPDHHGIVNNTFWDAKTHQRYSMSDSTTRNNPNYYLGEPIWITAQKQGVKTGSIYWVASDIPIKGSFPTYYKSFSKKPFLNFEQRIDTVVSWLQKPITERPKLILLYFEEPDHTGHLFGPESNETKVTVEHLDSLIGTLVTKIKALAIGKRVNLIITSDHGMTKISNDRLIDMNLFLKPEWCEIIDGRTPTSIFTKAGYRDSVYQTLKKVAHISVWKKEEIPAELNYGSSDRIGDIVVTPDLGWQFSDKGSNLKGAHGYFPQNTDMQVIFRACGPDFKKGYSSKKFINTNIYPLLAHLLDITPKKTDGQFCRIKDLLIPLF
ncbi:ectonucleotide pyrophosphatase/phosphodiesterase [uncultured Bacteroides sp.]|uniref:alkaline phosphatase family protein n=1 Tax=uncultured Bacteroides sp. TaxID=162156 RepID=UPI002AA78785|nr:ectonucleotide pyrophosphatase/phosphodiesterase [uncultured Bacteroides sp.]